ncbi:MAG: o-succinylbenzoate synthase [Bacteroidetes bacterium]|nr:o-succinylbenzoate synthase [Bacteroidota bacterium]
MSLRWTKYTLQFKQAAGTSRGVLKTKDSYFLKLEHEGNFGIGECGLLRGLSADDRPNYEERLEQIAKAIEEGEDPIEIVATLDEWPSIQAGLEMAILDLKSKNHILYPSDFTDGEGRQPINGLIWMGDLDFMQSQLEERIKQGFLVIKMKIGALDIEKELEVLANIRSQFGPHEIQLRVDANGAFDAENVLPILDRLDKLRIHSIEQPIKAGQWNAMAKLCQQSPIPIALDEELIGLYSEKDKIALLDNLKPRYIILKPSFLGGFKKSEEWVDWAEERNIGWWVTSALESNFGLSAIAQWNYNLFGHLASGLGTGSLYSNNFQSPLHTVRGTIAYDPRAKWDLDTLDF